MMRELLACCGGFRDRLRQMILDLAGLRGVGWLGHRLGGLPRFRLPIQLGVRDFHAAVGSRNAQDVEDRVIGSRRGFGQPAQIPARHRRVGVVLSQGSGQRGIFEALQHLACPIQRRNVS